MLTGLVRGPIAAACTAAVIALTSTAQPASSNPNRLAVLTNYANIAQAAYEDSLTRARQLKAAIAALLRAPGPRTLAAARRAWVASRVPYMQTEVYRFGNKIVDDWEGRVNAWPLDEGLIDYVAASYGTSKKENPAYAANVIANRTLVIGGKTIDASKITAALLRNTLHEFGTVEANVSTGYHAIEFLLWGQDLNGTGPGAGNRPWTDFSLTKCTGGNCDRRRAYLSVATDLLIEDLEWISKAWAPGGKARQDLMAAGPDKGIARIITGLGSLSYGELAGERMKLGLLLNDPEEEHDCFSDNTHNSHYYDVIGMANVYYGRYRRIDGRLVKGPSLHQLVTKASPRAAAFMGRRLKATITAVFALKRRAETVERYDQMLARGNAAGNATIDRAVDALKAQTVAIRGITRALGLKPIAFEGSDSLDAPAKVFQ